MRRDFLDVLREQKRAKKEDCVQKSFRLDRDLISQLNKSREKVSELFERNVTLSLLVRSILVYHLQVLQDEPSIECEGKEIDLSDGSPDTIEVSLKKPEPEPDPDSEEDHLVEGPDSESEDEYILRMLGDTSKKAGRSWKP